LPKLLARLKADRLVAIASWWDVGPTAVRPLQAVV